MVVNFANVNLNERPTMILKNAGGTPLGTLELAKNISLDLKYNEVSTLEFELPAYVDGVSVPYYDDVVGMRVIEVAGIGQFVLVNPEEVGDGVTRVKKCEANSLEYEFVYKKISIPNGTYRFYYGGANEDTILGMILEMMPSWSIGSVSSTLYNKYRTFDETNENVYNFIKGAVQESFNCIFDFDTMRRRINVRDANDTPASKPVYISTDNLAKEIEVKENTEDIVTRLDVNGAEGVDIRDVNPTGTNKIIMLDYFMTAQNFSQSLINKYFAWKSLCDSMRETYYQLSIQYSLAIMQKATERSKLMDLQGELTDLENVLGVTIQAVAQGLKTQTDLDAANTNIRAKEAEIAAKEAEIIAINTQAEGVMSNIVSIKNQCSFERYFTAAELQEMDKYIKDDELSESSFVAPTSASYGSDGNGSALSGSTVSVSGGTIVATTNTYGTIYDIRGGTISVNGVTAKVISCVWEKKAANGFLATAYLHSGTYSTIPFQGGTLSISGTYSGFTDQSSSGSLQATVTGYMFFTQEATEYEQRCISWELYEYGLEVISRLAVPTYSFSVTSANFLALNDFEAFKNNIELGQKVYLALKEDRVIEPICIGVRFSYGDLATLELAFSDSFASGDSEFRLVDLLDKSVSMGKNLALSRYIYSAFTDTGASNSIRDFMRSALDTAKNAILSSTDQAISWDGAGLRLRKYANEAQTQYEPEQIWMNNNSIVMTDDNWATAKMAIGKFHDDYAGDVWGIVAPMLVGTVLAGENLRIESSKRDGGISVFTVDADGARLYNSDFEIAKTVSGTTTHILLDPSSGIIIGKSSTGSPLYTLDANGHKIIDYDNANFYADDTGSLHLKGTLHGVDGTFTGVLSAVTGEFSGTVTAAEGAIGGWTLASNKLYSGTGTAYVALSSDTSNGAYTFWAGNETAASAPFRLKRDGSFVATSGNFTGTVTSEAGTIGGWTLASNLLYSGTGTSYVAMDSKTTDTYAFWAGKADAATAPFRVGRNGSFTATDGNFTGTVTSTYGEIGGWAIAAKRLSSGTGTSYVAMSSDLSGTYAIWAGGETAANAPFRVKRDGTVYATNGEFTGKVVATSGEFTGTLTSVSGTIGGWTLAANLLSSGSGAGYVALDSKTTDTYAIWAGADSSSGAPFRVKRDGTLIATNATITGTLTSTDGAIGGWAITTTKLYSGSTTTYVALDSSTSGTYAIWAGGETASSAPFRVKRDGTVYATNGEFTGKVTATSGSFTGSLTSTDGTIGGWTLAANLLSSGSGTGYVALDSKTTDSYVFWAGDSAAANAPFRLMRNGTFTATSAVITGTVTSTSGAIGGWTLAANKLHSGSGTSYVCLDSGTTNVDYAIWAGNATASSAPFSVKRDGTLKATKLEIGGSQITDGTITLSKLDSSAQSAISSAGNSALGSTVSCYYRSTTNTTPTISTSTTIGTSDDTSDAWEYVMPKPKNGCYFFTCERYTSVGGTVTFSTVRQMSNLTYSSKWCSVNDATYIDGAHIYTGSITATQIAAGTITAAKIATNTITGTELASNITISTTGSITLTGSGDINLNGNNWINLSSSGRIRFTSGNSTSVELTSTQISMTSGKFMVWATDDNSYIKFGGTSSNPNFSLGLGGYIKAKSITTDSLTVNGWSFASVQSGSQTNKFIVSSTQPSSGDGVIWFQPSSTSTITYTVTPSNAITFNGAYNVSNTISFSKSGTGNLAGSVKYGIKFRIYNFEGSCYVSNLTVQIKGVDNDTTSYMTIYSNSTSRRIGDGDYLEVDTLDDLSAAMSNYTSNSSLTVQVSFTKDASTQMRFEYQEFTLKCVSSSASGASACNVYYVP